MLENCPLYKSETCAVLNMPDCSKCPMQQGETEENVRSVVETYLKEADAEAVAGLFESETCTLCRKSPEKKTSYAVYDLGHPAEKPVKTSKIEFLLKKSSSFDVLVPLQFACCDKCRRRLWWQRNVKGVCVLAALIPVVLPVSLERSAEALRRIDRLMPIAIVLAALLIGLAVGSFLKKKLAARWQEETILHVKEHPVAKALLEKGWRPAMNPEEKTETLVFTRKPIDSGLGTAPSSALHGENN